MRRACDRHGAAARRGTARSYKKEAFDCAKKYTGADAEPARVLKLACKAIEELAGSGIDVHIFQMPGAPPTLNALKTRAQSLKGVRVVIHDPVDSGTAATRKSPIAEDFFGALRNTACAFPGVKGPASRFDIAKVRIGREERLKTECEAQDGWCWDETNETLRLMGTWCDAFLGEGAAEIVAPPPPAQAATGATSAPSASPCAWKTESAKLDSSCPGGRRHVVKLCQYDSPCEEKASWVTCARPLLEQSAAGRACPSTGRRIVTCFDTHPAPAKQADVPGDGHCTDVDAEYKVEYVCDGLSASSIVDRYYRAEIRDSPPAGTSAIEALDTASPGDRSVWRLRLGTPGIGPAPGGLGMSAGFRLLPALRALARSKRAGEPERDTPYYNRDGSWLDIADTIEVSAALAQGRRTPLRAANAEADLYSVGFSADMLEWLNGAVRPPRSGLSAIADCVRKNVAALLPTLAAPRPLLPQEERSIVERCAAKDAPFVLGTNLVIDYQRLQGELTYNLA